MKRKEEKNKSFKKEAPEASHSKACGKYLRGSSNVTRQFELLAANLARILVQEFPSRMIC